MTRDEFIETMARASYARFNEAHRASAPETWEQLTPKIRELWTDIIAASLTALESTGHWIAPVEPTPEMFDAAHARMKELGADGAFIEGYKAARTAYQGEVK